MPKFFLFLIFLLMTNFMSAAENVSMIQQVLQEENRNFFSPRSMKLDLLKNCPQTIPTLAEWIYEEWHSYDASLTKEKLIHAFSMRLNNDRIPLTFVVLKNDLPIGVISLKRETAPEFTDFPENSIWMGSLHVLPEERNQGLSHELLKLVQVVAKGFGYENLYLYISNPEYVRWYLNKGASLIEERSFRNHRIAIMQFFLKDLTESSHSS
jgi:predicted N-acetyltransferase YhbS